MIRVSDASGSIDTATFDYDTSDSIEEEEEDENDEETGTEKEGFNYQNSAQNQSPKSPKKTNQKERKSSINYAGLEGEEEEEEELGNIPGRRFRGRSIGGRDSLVSNFTLESSLGGEEYSPWKISPLY